MNKTMNWAMLISEVILILLVIGVVVMMAMRTPLDYTFTLVPLACGLIFGIQAIIIATIIIIISRTLL